MSVVLENAAVDEQFCDFKNSTVQDILKDSVDQELRQNSEDILSRLHPHSNPNISGLTEHLVLTSASCVSPQVLQSLKIKCIINVAPELPDFPLDEDIIHHKIVVLDSGNSRLWPYFDDAADLIHEVAQSGGTTLAYCVAGVSRSATMCIAYLMKHHQLTLLEAFNYVKQRRPKIKPNCGFFKQLIDYEKSLFGINSVCMVYNEFVQMEIPEVYDKDYRVVTNFMRKRRVRD